MHAGKDSIRIGALARRWFMNFRQKMAIAFTTMLFLPLLLTAVSFLVIGNYTVHPEGGAIRLRDYQTLTEDLETSSRLTDSYYDMLKHEIRSDPEKLRDREYLEHVSKKLEELNSFLIVRSGDDLYYTDDSAKAKGLFRNLPAWQGEDINQETAQYSYSVDNTQYLVKQLDFADASGTEYSIFILTRVTSIVPRAFLVRMALAITVILAATALLILRWFNNGVLKPINQLDVAMDKIRDGNLDYMLPTDEKGEIGDLYRSYEDMRLRLKESAEEKLDQEKANSELIRNISHDLKTPITSVKGYVEGLMDGVANTPEKQQKYLQTIYNKASDMDRLINELTLYARIDNDRIPYNFHRINVTDYFADCVDEIGMDMEARGIELDYSNLVDPATQIIADPEQLKRVINNIISNSVKYMDKNHQKIAIRIRDEQEDSIRIEIEDNGRGIAARDLSHIFDRFYRADSSRNSATGGSGIGLSIVKKIVEDHGGYIWATSTEGTGTCMHIVLRKYKERTDASVDGSARQVKQEEMQDVREEKDSDH